MPVAADTRHICAHCCSQELARVRGFGWAEMACLNSACFHAVTPCPLPSETAENDDRAALALAEGEREEQGDSETVTAPGGDEEAAGAVTQPRIEVTRLSPAAEIRARVEHLYAVIREHRAYELEALAGLERELRALGAP